MCITKIKWLLLSSFLSASCFISSLSTADDTEIFFSRGASDQQTRSNVLLMIDTSGSMADPADVDEGDETRLDAVKEATIDLVTNSKNVNIGLGAFAGYSVGGSILYPVVDLDTDVCENASCDSIDLKNRILKAADDAHQSSTGEMSMNFGSLAVGTLARPEDIVTVYPFGFAGSDSAEELEDGTVVLDNTELGIFYGVDSNRSHVGVRFVDVQVPAGAYIHEATISFSSATGLAEGDMGANIRIDSTPSSPTFSATAGEKISDRIPLIEEVEWPSIPQNTTYGELIDSPDLSKLVTARVAEADWVAGEPMTFILEPRPVQPSSATNFREFLPDPQLTIKYSTAAPVEYTTGLRFANVKIPRGATVQNARLRMVAELYGDFVGDLNVKAEAIGNSAPLIDTDFNLTGRLTTDKVTWTPETYESNEQYGVDIEPIINEIVNRDDWCGGNAITLLLDGPGSRTIRAKDGLPNMEAELQISYDPGSVDFDDTCLSQSSWTGISSAADDAVENLSTGVIDKFGEQLATQDGGELNLIALKFNNLDIPESATIISAELRLESEGFLGGVIDAKIYGESAANSAVFDAGTPSSISARTDTVAVDWTGVEQVAANGLITSPDIRAVVQEIVNKAGWKEGNSLSIMVEPTSSLGEYYFGSSDGENVDPAQLLIQYQIDGDTLENSSVVLRTARDEIIDVVRDLPATGGTPLVDYLYEAALYFRGEAVHFGKTRGDATSYDYVSRVSHIDSYTGGDLFQPPGCSEVDLNNVACIGEEIRGAPVYDAPATSSCLANNVVLLTDGDAQSINSKSLVLGLPGIDSCASKSNYYEECGVELADWLYKTDHDTTAPGEQIIKVHTIGFSYSSDFLTDLATDGGGQFHTVENASSLSNAFKEIVGSAADISTSYVSPTVTVSQLNSLSNSDEIYYAMFKPQVTAKWDGNLKRYALGEYGGETAVVDALGIPAIDENTGAISDSARSYWSDVTDGASTTEGGAASQLTLTRNILTFQPGASGPGSLDDFHETNTNLTAAALGLADDTYLTELIQWSRGVDIKDVDGDNNVAEVRTQIGDPLHSTPHVVHYAGATDTTTTIFVATNEGFLHAIDSEFGTEDYAIIPPELLPNLDVFFKNEVLEPNGRTYGLDGDVTGWVDDINGNRVVDSGESAYVVLGMRRGGGNYYAFNVSNPQSPEVAWVIKNTDPDFAELGETWSRPVKTKLKVDGVATHVLIFSGGYDNIGDLREERSDVATADSKGRAIFIVNAETGAFIRRFDEMDDGNMDYSIPSSPRVIDINFDGLADYLFVGDTGGQLWRLDFINATDQNDFELYGGVIADISSIGASDNRRFYYEPDVSVLKDENNIKYLNIAIGSGWRASPLNQEVEDRMYVLRDYSIFGPPRDEYDAVKYPIVDEGDLFDATNSDTSADSTDLSENGFYIRMQDPGEKIVSTGFTVNSNLLFTSYLPAAASTDACQAAVGSSHFYAIDARNGKSILNLDGTLTADGAEELGLSDRNVRLNSPGIAPSPSVLLPGGGRDPLVLVGLEEPDGSRGLDIGKKFKRTFWAEPENLNE